MEKRLLTLLALAAFGMNTVASDLPQIKDVQKLAIKDAQRALVVTGSAQTPGNYFGTAANAVNVAQQIGADATTAIANTFGEMGRQAKGVEATTAIAKVFGVMQERASTKLAKFKALFDFVKQFVIAKSAYLKALMVQNPKKAAGTIVAGLISSGLLYKLIKYVKNRKAAAVATPVVKDAPKQQPVAQPNNTAKEVVDGNTPAKQSLSSRTATAVRDRAARFAGSVRDTGRRLASAAQTAKKKVSKAAAAAKSAVVKSKKPSLDNVNTVALANAPENVVKIRALVDLGLTKDAITGMLPQDRERKTLNAVQRIVDGYQIKLAAAKKAQ